jgi:tetratricopeptide (TPR) repeat protein
MKPGRLILPLILVLVCCASAQRKPAKSSEKDPQYQYEKGVVALNYGLTEEAIRYGRLAVSLDPNHYGGHSLLGGAYYKQGNYADAIAEYAKAAELKPDLAEAHFNLGLACFEAGDMARAETEIKKANGLKEEALPSFYLARIYLGQKKLDQALEEAEKSIRKDPGSAGAYNLKGVILNQLGRFAEAAGSFQAGLVLAPNDLNLKINLGIAYINSNQPDKARPILEKALPDIKDPVLRTKIEEYLKSIKSPADRA